MNNYPFLLTPASKDYIWGGSRLNDNFNLSIPITPVAEAWVCSAHPDGTSLLKTGETLISVLDKHPEWLGMHALLVGNGKLPILIKLIDARLDLSVQVHPDDNYARQFEDDNGKTEMWYILDAKKDSSLVYGFNRDVSKTEIREAVRENRIVEMLNRVSVRKNDLFYIESGTVHAIGAGCLIVEIQESSNVTYRLYDYGRGRETHLEKALEVAKLDGSEAPRQPLRTLKYQPGYASEFLCRCKYFQVERMLLNTECRVMPTYKTRENSFHALVIVDGCGTLIGEKIDIPFFKGDCIFVPANSIEMKLHGRAQILDVSC